MQSLARASPVGQDGLIGCRAMERGRVLVPPGSALEFGPLFAPNARALNKVRTVASAAAPQLVSHFWMITPSWRISRRERTGPCCAKAVARNNTEIATMEPERAAPSRPAVLTSWLMPQV